MTQSYSINSVYAKGAFHPKLNFLIGDSHLLLILGSGNITSGGHGKNHEAFTAIYSDNINSPLAPILNEGWAYLLNISKKLDGFSRNRIERVIPKNCNLISKPPEKLHQFHKIDIHMELALIYNDETSIFSQLRSLIPSKNVNSITIVSPYYDEDGTFLLNLTNEFPNASLNVYLPAEQGLPPVNIASNKRINFFKWESTVRGREEISASNEYKRKLHSKLFFFHCDNYEYCLLGSANATIAAFGTYENRGINDEFGLLYKASNVDFLTLLGISGKKVRANLKELKRDTLIDMSSSVSHNIRKAIIIESCDLTGLNLKCFCSFNKDFKSALLCIYDDMGELVHPKTKMEVSTSSTLRLTSDELIKTPVYVSFEDDKNNVISNKQVINNVDVLYNTDPSKGNRAIRSIRSALEMGQINEYQLLGYLIELNEDDSKPKSVGYPSPKDSKVEKVEIHSEMTFEEAMAASKNKNHSLQLSTKHNSIQFWQTISSLLKERHEMVSEDLNEEEEDADASKSHERKITNIEHNEYVVKDGSELNGILYKTDKISEIIDQSMNRLYRDKSYEINEVLLCQFLLVSHIVTVLLHFNNYELPYDVEDAEYEIYTPEEWKKLTNGQYELLMSKIIITFSKVVLSHSIVNIENDDYRFEKLNSYIQEVVSNIMIYHYLINKNSSHNPLSEITDLACLNIFDKLGFPNDNFINRIELISKSKTKELFNTNGVIRLKNRLEKSYGKIDIKDGYFRHLITSLGICLVKKKEDKSISFKSVVDKSRIYQISNKDWSKL